MLSCYKVLDLSDEKGFLCGKILGDLGADVIKIEKPGGDPARRMGPFYEDVPDPQKSLYWFAYNTNKRGITLNIETQDGKELFRRLVKTADFVIESFSPGYMEGIGLGYSTLSDLNPGIIMISISDFGQAGPYKEYKGCDIVDWSMSGFMYMCGDTDRPPVRISFPHACCHGGADGAAGAMIALFHRQMSGEGQWIDVSIQQSLIKAMMFARPFWEYSRQIVKRAGSGIVRIGPNGPIVGLQSWPCKDGAIAFTVLGGKHGAATNQAMVKWMDEEGMADDFLKNLEWEKWDLAQQTQEQIYRINECLGRFFLIHTSAELYQQAKARKIMLYPVANSRDIVENPQLAARDFWEEVEHPELGAAITYPGAFVKIAETPLRIRRRAPLIGEHNEEIYGELGISREELIILKQASVI